MEGRQEQLDGEIEFNGEIESEKMKGNINGLMENKDKSYG